MAALKYFLLFDPFHISFVVGVSHREAIKNVNSMNFFKEKK